MIKVCLVGSFHEKLGVDQEALLLVCGIAAQLIRSDVNVSIINTSSKELSKEVFPNCLPLTFKNLKTISADFNEKEKVETRTGGVKSFNDPANSAFFLSQYFKNHHFDCIHFFNTFGQGYYISMAKHMGLAFAKTKILVTVVKPTYWFVKNNRYPVNSSEWIIVDYMEKQTLAHADHVIFPTHAMKDYLSRNGWMFPAEDKISIMRNIFPERWIYFQKRAHELSSPELGLGKINLVFWGDISPLSGFDLFVDTLDRLDQEYANCISVTIIATFNHPGFTKKRIGWKAENWNFPWQVFDHFSLDESLDYIVSLPDTLVVMPCKEENDSFCLQCLINNKIPFVVSNLSSVKEVLSPEHRKHAMFERNISGLTRKIKFFLDNQYIHPELSYRPGQNIRSLIEIYTREIPDDCFKNSKAKSNKTPLVSVCVLHRDRINKLKQAVASIEIQTYPNVEIVILDNNSKLPESIEGLSRFEARQAKYPMQFIHNPVNQPQAVARNACAAMAKGDYIIFLDDDDQLDSKAIKTFIDIFHNTSFDVLCSFAGIFTDTKIVNGRQIPLVKRRHLYVGDVRPVSYITNIIGTSCFMISAKVFFATGGFDETASFSPVEDWIFYLKAGNFGFKSGVIPEILCYVHIDDRKYFQNWRKMDIAGGLHRVARHARSMTGIEQEWMILLIQGIMRKL